MSTFIATFTQWRDARAALDELVNGGVGPDDISLIARNVGASTAPGLELVERARSVGDATGFVGRADDPERSDSDVPIGIDLLTTTRASRVSPVDTSDIATDVESVDQMDDSQNEAEIESNPIDGISHGAHDMDEVALTVLTGFPTVGGSLDDVTAPIAGRQEQFSDSLEWIEIPGVGLVIGGGPLATAALTAPLESRGSIVEQLHDCGVEDGTADEIQRLYKQGEAVLSVLITPGVVNETAIESVAEVHSGKNWGMFDSPRFSDRTKPNVSLS